MMESRNCFKNNLKYAIFFKTLLTMITDALIIVFSLLFAHFLVYEKPVTHILTFNSLFTAYIPIHIICTIFLFWIFGVYSSISKYAGLKEMSTISFCCFLSSLLYVIGTKLLGVENLKIGFYIVSFLVLTLTMIASRTAVRLYSIFKSRYYFVEPLSKKIKNVMIIGAGSAANAIIMEYETSEHLKTNRIVCVIDDDSTKVGKSIRGIKIVGTRSYIPKAAKLYNIDEIIFAIPSAEDYEKNEIFDMCSKTGCVVKTLPGMFQLINNQIDIKNIRKINIEDLLGRKPVKIKLDDIMGYISSKTIIVTGGGGSIGSELCRQIARYNPKKLIIFDIYENNAYDVQNELIRMYPDTNLEVLIGSVRDKKRIDEVFKKYKPDIVFHAAAHKHVPLMEDSPNESIKNNVFGTLTLVQAADKYNVDKFVLISTDKAVNPTNIMGASKRMCEMIVQSYDKKSKTEFVAVRFGNVLGSNGSVIPLFKKQIEEGGPVCVTHPDIIRYFMTIPEAASLVLEAGAFANGGEIFVLDMGKPIKIKELAENLIKLSGYTPYKDIDIVYTGLRPGEKLYEEMLMDEEGLKSTENNLIYIGKPIQFDDNVFFENLENLKNVISDESIDIREIIKQMVPTYRPADNSSNTIFVK